MTTATLATRTSAPAVGEVTQLRAIESEWIKLRSLRSTFWSLVTGRRVHHRSWPALQFGCRAQHLQLRADFVGDGFDATQVSLRGTYLAQLAIGVLGVLAVTGEYSTGMIRATLSAVPRRLPVLWAKLAVFAAVVFVPMGVCSLVAFEIGQAELASTHHSATLSTPGGVARNDRHLAVPVRTRAARDRSRLPDPQHGWRDRGSLRLAARLADPRGGAAGPLGE